MHYPLTFIKNHYFVDKSLFVKEIIKTEKAVLIIPRPRRFGKTLNLSMLKYFFDIREPENKSLFTGLKIWAEEAEITEKQGKHPVIYLSFKDIKQNSWIDTLERIKIELAKLFREHYYLLENETLLEIEKKEYIKISDKSADTVDFESCIYQLSSYLFRYHKEKVVILIDEYDTSGYKVYYEEVISFMRNLMSGAYKDNNYLYKGVITGILRVSKESIFSGLNNIGVYSILEDRFSDCFGFTQPEVKTIVKDFEVDTDFEEIKKWYNDYKFGNISNIYNPWSILNYAYEYQQGFKPFWVNTSSDDLLKERLKERDANYTREQLLKLINNETIEKDIDENFVFTDLNTDKELVWTLLAFSGYLTTVRKKDFNTYSLKIPNYEIKFVFKNIILKWLSVDIKIRKSLLEETTKYLINNEIAKFEKGFKEIIGDTFSYFDTRNEPENVCQSYVLGLLAIIGDDYIIKSNRESGEGRNDTSTSLSTSILLIPNDKSQFGIVIEIKQLVRGKKDTDANFLIKINNKIQEASDQIDKNKYYKELIDNSISNIIKLPIIFAGKVPYILPSTKL